MFTFFFLKKISSFFKIIFSYFSAQLFLPYLITIQKYLFKMLLGLFMLTIVF